MSIILTSGKRSAQKLREGQGNKKKTQQPSKVVRPKTAMPSNSYMPSENTSVWNERIDEVAISIALRKDTMEVWCNDEQMDVQSDFHDEGSYLDFVVYNHKARINITTAADKKTIRPSLTIDGRLITEVKSP